MIKYTSSDIIKRARQIADLEDSSFISWNENMALLNESYSSFYQKVIDKDEGYFVKNIELHYGENTLPNDFFQVKYVGLINEKLNTPILRRAKNENFVDLSYDIQGNKIFINGWSNGRIVLSYYKVPPTLAFPSDEFSIELPDDLGTLVDANKNFYAFINDNDIVVYNAKYNKSKTFTYPQSLPNWYCIRVFENALVVFYLEPVSPSLIKRKFVIFYYDGTIETYNENINYVVSGDKVVEVYNIQDYTKIFETDKTVPNFFYNDGSENLYCFDFGSNRIILNDNYEFNSVKFQNGRIYGVKKESVDTKGLFIYDGDLNLIEVIEDISIKFINDANLNTGYGVLKYDDFIGKYSIGSFIKDTELNFSNTFFFPVIAYNLARSYKIKQGADFSQINVKYEEVLHQFYDSISMDSNNCIRITKVE